jgi:hypothetical protein
MKYMSLIWEIPRAIGHLFVAAYNYSRGRGFTDEP